MQKRVVLLGVIGGVLAASGLVVASDHQDTPEVELHPRLDINDVYAFPGSSTVLIGPLSAGLWSRMRFLVPVEDGAAGPISDTVCDAPDPSKTSWRTRSSTASPVLSILIW